jgi:lipopolysaccharide transport system permease protein
MIVNLWRYRLFIVKNALSDVRSQNAGSAAGIAWHALNPLAQIMIYTVVFSQIMPVRLGGNGRQ